MTLLGNGVIAIWNDIRWPGRETFYRWHDEEHMAERVGIEGFLRGRRYIRLTAEIEWFTLYETVSVDVLGGKGYLERLNNPTPWTRQAVAEFYNVTRGLTKLASSRSRSDGGFIAAAAYQSDIADAVTGKLGAMLNEAFAEMPGICGVHLALTDQGSSRVDTAERKVRAEANQIPDLVVMLEATRAPTVEAARQKLEVMTSDLADLKALRAPGSYQLESQIDKRPIPA